MTKLAVLILLAQILVAAAYEFSIKLCPERESIFPCTCKEDDFIANIVCSNLQSVQELEKAVSGMKGRIVNTLEITKSNLGEVPGHLFNYTDIRYLRFNFANMISIGDDKSPPFTGLENSLEELSIIEGFWDYDMPLTKPIPLGHLKMLKKLTLENNNIPKVGNDWFGTGLENLRDFKMVTCLVKEVGDKAFVNLKNLHSFTFTGNSVTLPRTALPKTLPHLEALDLSGNELVEVPSNFFTGFPSLKYLYFRENSIRTLPEVTWKKILFQLSLLFVQSNPIVCDSKLNWIFHTQGSNSVIFGECALPERLKGRKLWSLKDYEIS